MKCDNCLYKKIHIGAGPPDDYSIEYCSNGHWEGGELDEQEIVDFWENCEDFKSAIPERIQRKRSKGWTMPENTVYVGRGSKWGNPHRVGKVLGPFTDGPRLTAKEAVKRYTWWLYGQIAVGKLNLDELRGKNLACWCKVGEPCHADVLLRLCKEFTF